MSEWEKAEEIVKYLRMPTSDAVLPKMTRFIGKTISRIQEIGNGALVFTFTDGSRFLVGTEEILGQDLTFRTDKDFDFDKWDFREK